MDRLGLLVQLQADNQNECGKDCLADPQISEDRGYRGSFPTYS
jgi:hypothetical protein